MHRLESSRMQKCLLMGSSPLDLYAREYFNSLNSIAEKISTDITTTVAAYEDLWHTLSIKDQHQVINETIIYPEVVLKYSLCKSEDDVKLHEISSRSFDEGKGIGITWIDEHSAPFSWKTRSQQNLSVFCEESSGTVVNGNCGKSVQSMSSEKIISSRNDMFIDPPNVVLGGSSSTMSPIPSLNALSSDNSNFLNKMKSKSVVLKIHTMKGTTNKSERNVVQSSTESGSSVLRVNGGCKTSKTLPSRLVSKPKNPPPPPPKAKQPQPIMLEFNNQKKPSVKENPPPPPPESKLSSVGDKLIVDTFSDFYVDISTSIKNDDLPKTGFDFLDNW